MPVKKQLLRKMHIAYNDAFRIFFGYCRRGSASKMFCINGVNDFNAIRRSAAYSLSRVANSENSIIKSIVNSNVFIESSISKEWSLVLFNIKRMY